jgi:hypothetical protein
MHTLNILGTGIFICFFLFIWFVRLLALRPLLAYCASLGWYWRWLWGSRWNVDWQGKPKFSEKTCPGPTFVHHKIPHDQTRVWTRAAAVGSRQLTAWAMARPGNRDSVVGGIATGYGLDDRGVGVRVPVRGKIFSSLRRPYLLWGSPSHLSNGYQGIFLRVKAAGAWSWPPTSN